MNKRLAAARERHQRWLNTIGVRRPTSRDPGTWRAHYREELMRGCSPLAQGSLMGARDATADRSLMKHLHRESDATRTEILRKASRVAPLYNKGGLQYPVD